MANVFAPPKVFANAALTLLVNNLVTGKLVDGEQLNKEFVADKAGGKVGGTVYVKRPPEFIVRDGRVASVQDVLEGEVAVSIDKQKGIDVAFTSVEETLSVSSLLKSSIMNSAMAQLASQIDADIQQETLEFPSWVGTPGQLIDSVPDFLKITERMDELAIPMVDRNAMLTPADATALQGTLLGMASMTGDVARSALMKGKIPMLSNTDAYMTQTNPTLTTGSRTATGAVNGASQNVAFSDVRTTYQQSLIIDGVGNAGTIKRGEVFTIAGVYAVNPRTKQTLPFLQQFTVLADATANGSGQVTITIANPIIISGAYQTVSAVPADDAVITWMGSASTAYRQNTSFVKGAIKLVSAKLIRPYTGEADFATDPNTGISIRYWRYSDGANDLHNHRFDVIYGAVNVDRRLGVRGSGTA